MPAEVLVTSAATPQFEHLALAAVVLVMNVSCLCIERQQPLPLVPQNVLIQVAVRSRLGLRRRDGVWPAIAKVVYTFPELDCCFCTWEREAGDSGVLTALLRSRSQVLAAAPEVFMVTDRQDDITEHTITITRPL